MNLTWQIGDVKVTRLVEIEMASAVTWLLPDATAERLAEETWLHPHFATADGTAIMSIHMLIIESLGQRIVVDTCVGNDKTRGLRAWNMRQGPFLEELEAAGFPPSSIDTVMCTHLHTDHVGWNTRLVDGEWRPTFPNARYLFHELEYRHWTRVDESMADVMNDSVKPIFDAGLVELVAGDHAINDEVSLIPTPGHTPGHVSVSIRSRGAEAVITGDLMHHPVQCKYPEWGSRADTDKDAANATRRDFIEQHVDSSVLIIGTHFADPTAGHIVSEGDKRIFKW